MKSVLLLMVFGLVALAPFVTFADATSSGNRYDKSPTSDDRTRDYSGTYTYPEHQGLKYFKYIVLVVVLASIFFPIILAIKERASIMKRWQGSNTILYIIGNAVFWTVLFFVLMPLY